MNKLVTFSAALERGADQAVERLHRAGHDPEMGGIAVHDAWSHLLQRFTATGVLAASSNVGTLEIAQQLGPVAWYDYERRFRHRQPDRDRAPGRKRRDPAAYVELVRRYLRQRSDRSGRGDDDPAAGLDVSDHRQRRRPGAAQDRRVGDPVGRIDRGGDDTRGQPRRQRQERPDSVRTMLESTILPGGTGVKAAIPGYRVARQRPALRSSPTRLEAVRTAIRCHWDTFAGIAPADNPQFVVAIMIDNPAHGLHGGDVAAPLYNQIGAYYVQRARISPSGAPSVHVPLLICDASTRDLYGSSVC